ncbi:hypothetical protein EYF80_026111 [Liparis tanakae]|uniref:Uncharacterized protein n=1 Tax=Liparis tanakae TaxID=230148 RepID=A0A4Z2HFD5_9TELE|nr:hypothetical protein EYF80_026111 [Liparis tanakae]
MQQLQFIVLCPGLQQPDGSAEHQTGECWPVIGPYQCDGCQWAACGEQPAQQYTPWPPYGSLRCSQHLTLKHCAGLAFHSQIERSIDLQTFLRLPMPTVTHLAHQVLRRRAGLPAARFGGFGARVQAALQPSGEQALRQRHWELVGVEAEPGT